MKKLCGIVVFLFFIWASIPAAQAQNVSEQGRQILFQFDARVFVLCEDGRLLEEAYAGLLADYMRYTIDHDLTERYLTIYDRQNERSDGALDEIVAEQRAMTTPGQLKAMYGPYEDLLSIGDFFKLHVLNATSVTAQLSQKLGPAKVRLMCSRARPKEE